MRIWSVDRFDAAGSITMEMAESALHRGATQEMKETMMIKLREERQLVRWKIKDSVHELMRMGAEITKMTYNCPVVCGQRACITPKNMRNSFIEDGSLFNIRCIHWIFSELPYTVHQDVLPHRKCHMDVVVEKVQRELNITWAPGKERGGSSLKNCLRQIYSKMLNDKKQTIIKEEGTRHGRKPIVRRPKSLAASGNSDLYRKNKTLYFWSSKLEGEHSVRNKEAYIFCGRGIITHSRFVCLSFHFNY